MGKKKTVFRVKGIIREEDMIHVLKNVPHVDDVKCLQTFRDKREDKRLTKKPLQNRTYSSKYGKFRYVELKGRDPELMKKVHEFMSHFFVRDSSDSILL